MGQFASRATTRLDLPEGQWIEARMRLTFGEEQQLGNAMLGGMTHLDTGAELALDMARGAVERIAVWVTDWSFRDDDDRPVAFSRDAIKALDPDWADYIDKALDAHVEALTAAKKAPNGRSKAGVRSA